MYQQGNYYRSTRPDSRDSVLSNAGRKVLGDEPTIQHNYVYDTKRRLANDPYSEQYMQNNTDMDYMYNNNPNAFQRYQENLSKLNKNTQKMQEYKDYITIEKDRLANKQRNLEGLKNLNTLNADIHRKDMNDQLNRARGYEPTKFGGFNAGGYNNNNNKYDRVSTASSTTDVDDLDERSKMLDQYVSKHNLNDPLAQFGNQFGAGGGGGNFNNNQRPQSNRASQSFDYGSMRNNGNLGDDGMGLMRNNNYQPVYQQNPNQTLNPYMPQQPQNYNNYPQVIPQQVYQISPQTTNPVGNVQGQGGSKEDEVLRVQLDQQARILERIIDKLDGNNVSGNGGGGGDTRRNLDSRDLDRRFKEYEKEYELKMELMKQQELIKNLTLNNNNNKNQGSDSKDKLIEQQMALLQGMMMLQQNQNNQYVDPYYQQYMMDPYMQQMYMMQGGYPPMMGGYPQYPDDKKKKKKKKRRKHSSSSSSYSSSESQDFKYTKKKKNDTSHNKSRSKNHTQILRDLEQERRKQEEEEAKEKELAAQRRKEALRKLRINIWCMVYPYLLENDTGDKVDSRKMYFSQLINQEAPPALKNLLTFMLNSGQGGFISMFNDSKVSYDYVPIDTSKTVSPSDRQKRLKILQERLKIFMEEIVKDMDTQDCSNVTLDFLATVSLGKGYALNYMLSAFELKRMQMNAYGRMYLATEDQQKMVIAFAAIVRTLIFQLVMKVKQWSTKIQWNDNFEKNFKIVGSVLYRITIMAYREKLPIINQDVTVLPARPIPVMALENAPIIDDPNTDELVSGFIEENKLNFHTMDKTWLQTMKGLIDTFAAKLLARVIKYRELNPPVRPGSNAGGNNLPPSNRNSTKGSNRAPSKGSNR